MPPDDIQTEVQNPAATQSEAAETPTNQAGAPAAADPPPTAAAGEETKTETKTEVSGTNQKDWRDDRIRVLTAKLHEEKSRTASLEARVNEAPGARDQQVQQEAERIAAEKLAIKQFNDQCADAATKGRAKFGSEFDSSLKSILEVAGAHDGKWLDNESAARYNQFLAVAFEAGDAARLIHDLGSDKQEFARILALSPVKQAAELAKRVAKAEAAVAPAGSSLPKPITPVGARGNTSGTRDPSDPEAAKNMSTADWMAARTAQANASYVDMRRGVR